MMPRGVKGKELALTSSAIWSSGITAVFSVLTVTETGLGDADGVGELHFGTGARGRRRRCFSRCSGPCSRRCDPPLTGVFTAERTAAVGAAAAVAVDDDLPAG